MFSAPQSISCLSAADLAILYPGISHPLSHTYYSSFTLDYGPLCAHLCPLVGSCEQGPIFESAVPGTITQVEWK